MYIYLPDNQPETGSIADWSTVCSNGLKIRFDISQNSEVFE